MGPTPIEVSDRLASLKIASPCGAKWDEMIGDERVRRCAACGLNVHNVSAMSRGEAEEFLLRRAGAHAAGGERACLTYAQRADGTILTRDCPIGAAEERARVRRGLVRALVWMAVLGVGAGVWAVVGGGTRGSTIVRERAGALRDRARGPGSAMKRTVGY